ncbi:MAG TPA: TMEM14 family protein [Fimbriimonadaceae bacterium]|nr:TMEM14 family protein [Fimbriimonadaceae bacterium]HRJ33622.1 TMEM14 family protein [Fimbriimonadaceae bacterium]
MRWPQIVLLGYGIFNIALGLEAFLAKGSMPSLIGGVGAGVLVLVAFGLTFKAPRWGYIMGTLIALGLAGRFLPMFFKDSSNVYPALVIGGVSVLVVLLLVGAHFAARKHSQSASGTS